MLSDPTLAQELREAMRPLFRRLNAARTMSLGKSGILAQLIEQGPTTASELAASQQITPQAVTAALREMDSAQLIERTPDEVDRRRIWVSITAAGRQRLAADRAAGQAWLDGALTERLDDEERAALRTALPALRALTGERTLSGERTFSGERSVEGTAERTDV
ncbi:MarR family winged helix-turn-helix transcriptional regulator [Brachybacterium paraconglomeratum]|uniref:MarR family winged helix-turn-helix transcriptional regulator n=1 Tax=Brachybacterium paraconglomeratum TaxID=173362 RepID=UPI0031E65496